jgi:PhnB protein
MEIQPYLSFEGRCDEAIAFYRRAVDAEVTLLMRFKDMPKDAGGDCQPDPKVAEKVMHASLRIGDSIVLASDGRCAGEPNFKGINLSLIVRDEAEAERRFNALADGGQVHMPLAQTFFSKRFGMLADRFGVSWMVLVRPA